ncbi:hypothetical protein T09_12806 [Trichinella sp. T9]|nr:hypothetical protein T09_12806 [Trichinella sp. T9]
MFILIFTLSFVTYVNAAIGNFECLQDNGGASKGADCNLIKWIQYKLAEGLDSFVISDTVAQWAAVAVNAATSPTVYTFDQYLAANAADKVEAAVLAYNSHPPFLRRSLKSSSSKDEQPDRHMHLTYPWPPVALVTAVLRGISASDANFLSLQPTVYNPSHSAMTTTKKFLGSAGPRSTSGTLSVQF